MRASPTGAAVLLAAALALALLLTGLGRAPFDDPGEGQHAEIAREMWSTRDWLTLRLNGVRYFDKPPLLYWLAAGAFALLGPSEWAARLVPVAGAVLAVAGTAILGARLLGARAGFYAGAALLSAPLFTAFARYVRPETLFLAGIQWGMAGLLLAAREAGGAGRGWAMGGALALGLAALSKDPLGLVGPLAAVAVALTLSGQARPVARWLPWRGLGLMLLVGLGWYAMASLANAGYLWYTVVDNHVLNAARLRHFPDEDVPLGAAEFLVVGALGALPWIPAAALTVVRLARRRAWRSPEEAPWVALALWLLGSLGLVALVPFRLPQYALPAYPALALLAARGWRETEHGARGLLIAQAALYILIAAVCGIAAWSDGRAFTDAVFSVTDVYARKEAVLGQAAPVPPWGELRPLVFRTGLVALLGAAGLHAALGAPRLRRWGPAVALGTALLLAPSVTAGLDRVASWRAVAALAAEARRELGPSDLLVHEGPIENSGALEWYAGRRPVLLDARRSVLAFGATFPEAREIFWDAERFRREWLGSRRLVHVTTRAPERSLLRGLPAERVRLLAAGDGRWLFASVPASR
ncbi:MAG TPA: glycosyltransferase family 39 protein [Methylomirabilota bacterium]|nr:glycosyltransferase family 39 protein [Methylomirabilota bacterium]